MAWRTCSSIWRSRGRPRAPPSRSHRDIENVGGEINAATSVETTSFYARVLSDDVPLAVDILADILQDSTFDPAELEREQHVILQEIGAAHDTPDDIVFDRFSETAFRHQTIGRSILGTPETVEVLHRAGRPRLSSSASMAPTAWSSSRRAMSSR